MGVQAEQEPMRDYVTHWTELRNSCERVHEVQVIHYFVEGCQDATLLKHKLMYSESATLDKLRAKVNKYATTESMMRIKITAIGKAPAPPAPPRPTADNRGQQINKRKSDQPDPWYGRKQVATAEDEHAASQAAS
ncbi:hypothetical protein ZWY2020_033303 [Hordeum vulgare]|nr:hypothetical protein ZWY2020_033303 [Hordeum vulgare]